MEIKKRNYFSRLLNGEISLAVVFWFWFVFLSFFLEYLQIEFAEFYIVDEIRYFSIYLLLFLYSSLIFFLVFKSANNYQGNKIWSFFAKVILTINLFYYLTSFIEVYKYTFLEDYFINKEIEAFRKDLPIAVDFNSTLIDIYKENKNIFYKYDFKNFEELSLKDKEKLKKQVNQSICENNNTLELLKKDYILKYEYVNSNNEKIMEIATTKYECGDSIYDLEILAEIMKQQGML